MTFKKQLQSIENINKELINIEQLFESILYSENAFQNAKTTINRALDATENIGDNMEIGSVITKMQRFYKEYKKGVNSIEKSLGKREATPADPTKWNTRKGFKLFENAPQLNGVHNYIISLSKNIENYYRFWWGSQQHNTTDKNGPVPEDLKQYNLINKSGTIFNPNEYTSYKKHSPPITPQELLNPTNNLKLYPSTTYTIYFNKLIENLELESSGNKIFGYFKISGNNPIDISKNQIYIYPSDGQETEKKLVLLSDIKSFQKDFDRGNSREQASELEKMNIKTEGESQGIRLYYKVLDQYTKNIFSISNDIFKILKDIKKRGIAPNTTRIGGFAIIGSQLGVIIRFLQHLNPQEEEDYN